MGGIGKTQLAVEYCYRYRDSYPGGVFWLNAAADWRAEFAGLGTYLEPELAGEPEVRRIGPPPTISRRMPTACWCSTTWPIPAAIRRPVTPDLDSGQPALPPAADHPLADLGSVRPVEVTVLPEAPAVQLLLRLHHGSRHWSRYTPSTPMPSAISACWATCRWRWRSPARSLRNGRR